MDEYLIRASNNINIYFKYEIYSSIILTFLALLDNNLIELLFAIIILGYNIYSRIKGTHNFSMIIGDSIDNLKNANKVGFRYKVKFLFYTLVTCSSTVIFMLQCLGVTGFLNKLKIIS